MWGLSSWEERGGLWVLLSRDKTLERFHRRGAESEDPSWIDLPRPGPLDQTKGGANEKGRRSRGWWFSFPFPQRCRPLPGPETRLKQHQTMFVRWEGDGWSDCLLSIIFRGDQGKGQGRKVGGKREGNPNPNLQSPSFVPRTRLIWRSGGHSLISPSSLWSALFSLWL